MRDVSEAFMRALPVSRQLIECYWSNDMGDTWTPFAIVGGSVTADRTQQTRWSCTVTATPEQDISLDGIRPYGTRVSIQLGIKPLRGEPEYVPLGVYRVNQIDVDTSGAVSITGTSLESQIIDSRFLVPTTFGGGPGDTARNTVEDVVRDAVPDASFRWVADGEFLLPVIHQDQDRMGFIAGTSEDASITNSMGAEFFADGAGVFAITPTPSLYDVSVWDVAYGEALVSASISLTRENVYNVVVATGESTDENTPAAGPGVAWDSDPDSPTFAGPDPVASPELSGPFGIVPRFYTSSLLLSDQQCQVAASAIIADALGLQKSMSFDSIKNPALEPGDVVRVEIQPGIWETHLIDSVSFDLEGASMSCQTRATQSRLIGVGDYEQDDTPQDIQDNPATEDPGE